MVLRLEELAMGITVFIITLITTMLANKIYYEYAKNKGILAPDMRKKGHPMIPKWGGLIIPVIYPILILASFMIQDAYPEIWKYTTALVLSSLIGYAVGVLDDLHVKKWDYVKIIAVALAGLPIIILGAYFPRPIVPFVGRLRITILYPLLILLAFAVIPNGLNMLDLVNGVVLFSQILLIITTIIWTYILGNVIAFQMSVIYLALLLSMYMYNKYPAKMFISNSGTYTLGTISAAIIIFSRLEYIGIILLLPMILNSFSLLATLKVLMTREEIKKKIGHPNYEENGIIYPTKKTDVPINLVRMIVLHGPLDEEKVVKIINGLFIITTILANILAYQMYIMGL